MNHPSELLADLVDGTLDADARVRVDAHLAVCTVCRDDLAAAVAGRDTLRALPSVPTPADLHDRIVAEARGRGAAGAPGGMPRWSRWAGAAAAAALIVAIATTLPEIGGGAADQAAPESAVGGGSYGVDTAPTDVPLVVRDEVNYGPGDLERLASGAATLTGAGAEAAAVHAADPDEADRAASCVVRSFDGRPPGRLVRLIRARFEGRSAYLAVYLEGPGAGQDPDLGVVYVTSAADCRFVTVTQARI